MAQMYSDRKCLPLGQMQSRHLQLPIGQMYPRWGPEVWPLQSCALTYPSCGPTCLTQASGRGQRPSDPVGLSWDGSFTGRWNFGRAIGLWAQEEEVRGSISLHGPVGVSAPPPSNSSLDTGPHHLIMPTPQAEGAQNGCLALSAAPPRSFSVVKSKLTLLVLPVLLQ